MWVYDLHLYTVAYFTRGAGADLFAMRGAVLAMLAPPVRAAAVRNAAWRIQLSRAATFQSLSVIAILVYLIAMMSAARALEIVGGDWARIGQVGIVFAMTLAALVLLPSGKLRAWLRVVLAKHLFEHRYDYRQEWLRFTDTVGRGGAASAPLEERVVKALADIADAPAGLLLLADEQHRLTPAGALELDRAGPGRRAAPRPCSAMSRAAATSSISQRSATAGWSRARRGCRVPAWLAALEGAWAGVPLIHGDRLAGLVILDHPPVRRPLDWEDFDLFRTAGIQAASYLAEARASRRSPTPSASTSSTAASPSSCTTSRIWSASSAWSRAMPSATPTIPNSAPT